MAEFTEVMHQWARMCEAYDMCKKCALNWEDIQFCHVPDTPRGAVDFIERTVMDWAAKNPEPVYPTWFEWFAQLGLAYKDDDCTAGGHRINVAALSKPIPADIAEKLGIKPKETP